MTTDTEQACRHGVPKRKCSTCYLEEQQWRLLKGEWDDDELVYLQKHVSPKNRERLTKALSTYG